MLPLAEPYVLQLDPYKPGKSIRDTEREYGVADVVKLASNENPFGPSPKALEAAQKALYDGHMYPNILRGEVKECICAYLGSPEFQLKHIMLGNGSNELISLLARALLSPRESLLNAWPSFLVYRMAAQAMGRHEHTVPLSSAHEYDLEAMVDIAKARTSHPVKLVFIANPNNPTGRYITRSDLERFFATIPEDIVVVFDEAYADYVDAPDYESALRYVLVRPRTVVLKTFSKIYGMAGFRIGYAVADPQINDIIHRVRDPFNVNGIAQAAAMAALQDNAHVAKSRQNNSAEMPRVVTALQELGLVITPSAANFVLVHLAPHMPSVPKVMEALIRRGVIVRSLENYDLPSALRVTIGTPAQNGRFLNAMAAVLKTG